MERWLEITLSASRKVDKINKESHHPIEMAEVIKKRDAYNFEDKERVRLDLKVISLYYKDIFKEWELHVLQREDLIVLLNSMKQSIIKEYESFILEYEKKEEMIRWKEKQ